MLFWFGFAFLALLHLSRKMMRPMTEEPPTIDPMEMLIFTFTVGPPDDERDDDDAVELLLEEELESR